VLLRANGVCSTARLRASEPAAPASDAVTPAAASSARIATTIPPPLAPRVACGVVPQPASGRTRQGGRRGRGPWSRRLAARYGNGSLSQAEAVILRIAPPTSRKLARRAGRDQDVEVVILDQVQQLGRGTVGKRVAIGGSPFETRCLPANGPAGRSRPCSRCRGPRHLSPPSGTPRAGRTGSGRRKNDSVGGGR
jgi:hypothetical protein